MGRIVRVTWSILVFFRIVHWSMNRHVLGWTVHCQAIWKLDFHARTRWVWTKFQFFLELLFLLQRLLNFAQSVHNEFLNPGFCGDCCPYPLRVSINRGRACSLLHIERLLGINPLFLWNSVPVKLLNHTEDVDERNAFFEWLDRTKFPEIGDLLFKIHHSTPFPQHVCGK